MRRLLCASAIALFWSSAAAAEVLTPENMPILCTDRYQGKPAVNRDELAFAIVGQAPNSLRFLDGANAGGLKDRTIQMSSTSGIPGEPLYAIRNAGLRSPASANRPFGPKVDLAADKAAGAAAAAISAEIAKLADLLDDDVHVAGEVTYRVVRTRASGTPADRADAVNPLILFGDNPPVVLCEAPPQVAGADPVPAVPPADSEGGPPSVGIRPVLRGTVKDLATSAEDLKDAEAASIGFEADDVAGTKTFHLDAVAGVRIAAASGAFEAIPFLSYERKRVKGGDGDSEIFAPGLLFASRFHSGEHGFHTRLEASYIHDVTQGSRQGKLRLYVDPAIWLGPGRGTLFGANLPMGEGSPLVLRPKLTLIGDVSKIFRSGSSEALAEADSYWGLGGDLSLRVRFAKGSPVSDFVLAGGVRYLKLFGEIDLERARRWYGSVEYAPDNAFIGLAFEFNKGRNDDSFEEEDTYGLALKLRY